MTNYRSANGRPPQELDPQELYDLSRSGNEGFVCLYVALACTASLACTIGFIMHILWAQWWLL